MSKIYFYTCTLCHSAIVPGNRLDKMPYWQMRTCMVCNKQICLCTGCNNERLFEELTDDHLKEHQSVNIA